MKSSLWDILSKVVFSSKVCPKVREHTCNIEACKLECIVDTLCNSKRIVVLPCELNTTIYRIDLEIPDGQEQCSDCQYNSSGFGEFYCDYNYKGWPTMEDKLSDSSKVCPKFVPYIQEENMTLEFWSRYAKWFNVTWFLSESEAVSAMKGYKNDASLFENNS